jgi:regulatory protein YycI of two-component signal transduction system YycFG
MKTTGIIVIVIGLILTIFTTFSFFTKEKVVDVGKIEISRDKEHNLKWPPLIGVAIMIVGGVIVYRDYKNR